MGTSSSRLSGSGSRVTAPSPAPGESLAGPPCGPLRPRRLCPQTPPRRAADAWRAAKRTRRRQGQPVHTNRRPGAGGGREGGRPSDPSVRLQTQRPGQAPVPARGRPRGRRIGMAGPGAARSTESEKALAQNPCGHWAGPLGARVESGEGEGRREGAHHRAIIPARL